MQAPCHAAPPPAGRAAPSAGNRPANLRFYSQHGEDYLLWNLFDFKPAGVCVDVGAFDGVHLSNSFSFEQQGWFSICVEPHPVFFRHCRVSRPRSICLNCACVADKNLEAVEFLAEDLGLLSGTLPDRADAVKERYAARGIEFKGLNRIAVPAATLNALLDKHLPAGAEIDFISIDVEGTELQVVQGIDLARFRPRVLLVEANTEMAGRPLHEYLVQRNGYIDARHVGVNIAYVRDEADAAKLRAVEIKCKIEKQLHPLGKAYTLPSFTEEQTIAESSAAKRGFLASFLRRSKAGRHPASE